MGLISIRLNLAVFEWAMQFQNVPQVVCAQVRGILSRRLPGTRCNLETSKEEKMGVIMHNARQLQRWFGNKPRRSKAKRQSKIKVRTGNARPLKECMRKD